MEAKHTPGPWAVDEHMGALEVINEETGFAVTRVNYRGDLGLANARLMAAAPEMLEALQDVLSSEPGPALNDRVRAAIAQAMGEEQ